MKLRHLAEFQDASLDLVSMYFFSEILEKLCQHALFFNKKHLVKIFRAQWFVITFSA